MFLRRKKEEKGEKTYGKGARRKETSPSLFAYAEIWLMLKCCEGKTLFHGWKVAQAKARGPCLSVAGHTSP
jgi:hypothetical protein